MVEGVEMWDHDEKENEFYLTPEPVAIALLAAGIAALYGFARIRRKR